MGLAHDPLETPNEPQLPLTAQEDEDLRWLVADERGRRIVLRLLDHAAPFTTSYRNDAQAMALTEGRKQTGYFLLRELTKAAPEQAVRMILQFTKGNE